MLSGSSPGRSVYEHKCLPGILDGVIPEVARDRVFGTHEGFADVNPNSVSDQAVLEAVQWDGTFKRKQKWMMMSGEFVLQAEMAREELNFGQDAGTDANETRTCLGSLTDGKSDIDWMSCYNESADAVAIYIDSLSCAETVKSALRRETFGEGISIEVPREVLRRLEARVRDRHDVTVEQVIGIHREAIERFA